MVLRFVDTEVFEAMEGEVVGVVRTGGVPSGARDEDDIWAGELPVNVLEGVVKMVGVSEHEVFGAPSDEIGR